VARLAAELDETRAKRSALAAEVEHEEDAATAAIESWAEGLRELSVDAGLLEHVIEAALAPPATRPDRPWADAAQADRDTLVTQRAALNAERDRLTEQIDALQTERDELAEQPEPRPDRRGKLRADRDETATPLWRLVDFKAGLIDTEQAQVEAALEEAGLLDALVDAADCDGDSRLIGDPQPGRTLADMLVAKPGDTGVTQETIAAILRSVPYGSDGPVSVSAGRFRLGPLHGRYGKPAAQFIGAAARAAHRRCWLTWTRAWPSCVTERPACSPAPMSSMRAWPNYRLSWTGSRGWRRCSRRA
jgi:hypothetical protein